MKRIVPAALVFVAAMTMGACAPRGTTAGSDLPPVHADGMLRTVVPDLTQRLARFKPVVMFTDELQATAC